MVQELADRVKERIRAWGLLAEGTLETQDSVLIFGTRNNLPVVLKVIKLIFNTFKSEVLCLELLTAVDLV